MASPFPRAIYEEILKQSMEGNTPVVLDSQAWPTQFYIFLQSKNC